MWPGTERDLTDNGKGSNGLIREDTDSTARPPGATATAPALAPTEVPRRGPRCAFETNGNSGEPELPLGGAGSGFLSARRGTRCAPPDRVPQAGDSASRACHSRYRRGVWQHANS